MLHKSFLYEVAEFYLNDAMGGLIDRLFIFPSKRAKTFFLRYLGDLAKEQGKPILAPRCTTVNEFILGLCHDIRALDRTELLFKLYDCYASILMQDADSFDSFLFWGDIILKDFDLIDRNLVDVYQLYSNTSALKELEDLEHAFLSEEQRTLISLYWREFKEKSANSEYRERFLSFWSSLGELYVSFYLRCKEDGWAYEGLIYREVASRLEDLTDKLLEKYERVQSRGVVPLVFVGLFELSQSELSIFKRLREKNLAEFVWDEDVCIIRDTRHRANKIMQRVKENLGYVNYKASSGSQPEDYLPKDIRVYKCATTITQVKVLPELLSQISTRGQQQIDTAIILPDEQLLLPVVSSIPSEYTDLNITLGYPLNKTSVAILLNRWMTLLSLSYESAYPLPELISLLTMQLLTQYYPGLQIVADWLRRQKQYMLDATWIVERLIPRKRSSLSVEEQKLLDGAIPLLRCLLLLPDNSTAPRQSEDGLKAGVFLSNYLSPLLGYIVAPMVEEALSEGHSQRHISFDLNFLKHYQDLVTRLRGLMDRYEQSSMSRDSLLHLLDGLTQGYTIPFKGDPLKGLQIIGVLESRALSFPHVVYMSASEGKLPKTKIGQTFIPFALRKSFGLPTVEDQDTYEAYRFYQTIACSTTLSFIYGIHEAEGNKAEITRYLGQIEKLYARTKESSIAIKTISVNAPLGEKQGEPEPISKGDRDGYVAQRLSEWLSADRYKPNIRQLSPSSFNKYLQCPLRFYYTYIEGLKEEDTPENLLQSNDFGTILHSTMQEIYKVGVNGSPEQIDEKLVNRYLEDSRLIEGYVRREYERIFSSGGTRSYRLSDYDEYNIKIIVKCVQDILQHDITYTPFLYVQSEANVHLGVELGKDRVVHFTGFVDRIDSVGGDTRIVDYKTGVDQKKTYSLDAIQADPEVNKAMIQTFLYCDIIKNGECMRADGTWGKVDIRGKLIPALYITKDLSRSPESYDPYFYKKGNAKDKEPLCFDDIEAEYMEYIKEKLNELFDLGKPFEPCLDVENCRYCPFKRICRR